MASNAGKMPHVETRDPSHRPSLEPRSRQSVALFRVLQASWPVCAQLSAYDEPPQRENRSGFGQVIVGPSSSAATMSSLCVLSVP